jgi:hypothetical protein
LPSPQQGKGTKDNQNVGAVGSQDTSRVAAFTKRRENKIMGVGDKRQMLER